MGEEMGSGSDSGGHTWIGWRRVVASLAALGVVVLSTSTDTSAEIIDLPPPSSGCLDSVADAVGLFEDNVDPAGGVSLDVAGPVAQVIVEWMGEFRADPAAPGLGLTVTEPGGAVNSATLAGVLSSKDSQRIDGTSPPFTYSYWDDATTLFGARTAGTYAVDFTPPPDGLSGQNHWWGATITVVYDTTPCGQIADFIWKIGADYYFGGAANQPPTTDLIVYALKEPLASDLLVTVRASHGGSDSSSNGCRVSVLWVGTGTGVAPTLDDNLVDNDGNPVYPGAVEGVTNPFTAASQSCPGGSTFNPPVQDLRGGNVGTEYALITMDVLIPAGSTWMAFQLESPRDNGALSVNGETRPESGGWGGGGLLFIPAIGDPSIRLEKTVLDGAGGACPAVEGTDELVTTAQGNNVTYCFRVINDGTTSLFPVTLDDPALGIDQSNMTLVSGDDTVPLLIGAEMVYRYESTATGDLNNVATVTGIPVDGDGDEIDELDPVDDTNDATVNVIVPPTTTTIPPTTTTIPPTTSTTTTTTTTTTIPPTTTTTSTIPPTTTSATSTTLPGSTTSIAPTTVPESTTTTPVATSPPTTLADAIDPETRVLPETGRGGGSLAAHAAATVAFGVLVLMVARRRPDLV